LGLLEHVSLVDRMERSHGYGSPSGGISIWGIFVGKYFAPVWDRDQYRLQIHAFSADIMGLCFSLPPHLTTPFLFFSASLRLSGIFIWLGRRLVWQCRQIGAWPRG
jgi:hypothetical protein